jgi:hypothetical protein
MIAFAIAAGIYLNLGSKKYISNPLTSKKFVFIQEK